MLLGKTDRQRYGKKERETFKDRPRAALDDGSKNVPRGSVYGEIADDVRRRCESGDADHEARYRKQHGGREHGSAKTLDFLQHNMPSGCNMLCEQERLNNELIVEDWLLAALTVLIRSDLGFGGTVDGK